jgi:serine/threonine-protein kinase
VSRVCRALDFAHNFVDQAGRRLDIVHRDVSPGNVMVSWDGHIKLADFGIAKARTSIDPAEHRPMMMGKKHYMSPEQMLGLSADPRSDVFALGVVLYELLTLERLFTEEMTELAIDEVAIHPLPDIRARIPGIAPELERVLYLALDKDPDRRPTAAAMGRALDAWCSAQRKEGSPDRLQEHLAQIFPTTYQPLTAESDEETSFKNLRRALVDAKGTARRGILSRIFGG